MSFWELFNLRAQSIGQQTVIAGQRGATAQLERIIATSAQTIAFMKQDLEIREQHRSQMSREMAKMEDEIYAMRDKLRPLRQESADLSEANAKLVRENHARRRYTAILSDRCEARGRIFRMTRDIIGKEEVERAFGTTAIVRLDKQPTNGNERPNKGGQDLSRKSIERREVQWKGMHRPKRSKKAQ